MNTRRFLLCAAVLFATLAARAADAPKLPAGYKLLYEQNFTKPDALKDFVFTDASAWRLSKEKDKPALELHKQSAYKPEHRSPLNIALIADKLFGDFVLEVELLSTKKPYGHQDMCLFFGFTGSAQYYYNHIAVAADPHAHNVFIVDGAPRKNFAKETTKGITWGEREWHKIRAERDTQTGTYKVFFDDFSKPIMLAEDKTFLKGHIGFGSFDDVGMVTSIKIWGPSVETKKAEFFKKAE
ncbi:MAG: hypothetical protein HZA92_07730 [Verrucomicrobia bacterium]|nr:hypothetical protein [Verrucomicrobiota bacterium]